MEPTIVDARKIKSQNELVSQLCEIDRACFTGLKEEDEGSEDFWRKNRRASYAHILFHNQKPVGYIDFLSINEVGLKVLCSGSVHDGGLEGCIDLSDSKTKDFYIPSICILPEYRGSGLSKKLWNSSRMYFLNNSFFIKSLFTVIWTSDGERFFSKFVKETISKDEYGHHVVRIQIEDGQLPVLE